MPRSAKCCPQSTPKLAPSPLPHHPSFYRLVDLISFSQFIQGEALVFEGEHAGHSHVIPGGEKKLYIYIERERARERFVTAGALTFLNEIFPNQEDSPVFPQNTKIFPI